MDVSSPVRPEFVVEQTGELHNNSFSFSKVGTVCDQSTMCNASGCRVSFNALLCQIMNVRMNAPMYFALETRGPKRSGATNDALGTRRCAQTKCRVTGDIHISLLCLVTHG